MSDFLEFIAIEGDPTTANVELVLEGGNRVRLMREKAERLAKWITDFYALLPKASAT
jgi:hypothetical protein